MYKIVEFSHLLIKDYIEKYKHNDMIMIDATCGRGNDTKFMAQLLNGFGHVYSYDIQLDAINSTKELLAKENINNVTLLHQNHNQIDQFEFDLILYNLGYLPNGDKNITTTHQSTIQSIELALSRMWLNPQLLIIIVLYPGHKEGKIESDLIDDLAFHLNSKEYLVTKYLNYNRPSSPYIITISKNQFQQKKVL